MSIETNYERRSYTAQTFSEAKKPSQNYGKLHSIPARVNHTRWNKFFDSLILSYGKIWFSMDFELQHHVYPLISLSLAFL